MTKVSTPTKPPTFAERLRRLRWWGIKVDPTTHESDVGTVLQALSTGDEVMARRLAEVVETHWQRRGCADDMGVREYWLGELASWNGAEPAAAEIAGRFVNAMANFLRRYAEHPAEYVDTAERVEAVRLAFERTMASRFYERNPGRSMLSAGLAAMGVPRKEIDDMLDAFRKR